MIKSQQITKVIVGILVTSVAIILVSCLNNTTENSRSKYPVGKDTIKTFGDATFQIQKTPSKKHMIIKYPEHALIERHVYTYKGDGDLVYIFGQIGFTVLNTSNYQVKQYRDFNGYSEMEINDYKIHQDTNDKNIGNIIVVKKYEDFSEEEKLIFDELKNSSEKVKQNS